MSKQTPPVRLVGGTHLRDGRLSDQPLTIADGLIGGTADTDIDLSGHLILPGIVDLRSSSWMAHMPPGRPRAADVAAAVTAQGPVLARAGITTAWISAVWTRANAYATAEIADAVVASVPALAQHSHIDTAARIEIDTHLTHETERVVALIARGAIAHLALRPVVALLQELADADANARSAWTKSHGISAQTIDRAMSEAHAVTASVPRHLCRIAEACDGRRIGYSSQHDKDAEAREYYRMLGARLTDAPQSRAAAQAARAMGDPVLLEARDVIGSPREQSWIGDGLVDAMCSAEVPSSALRAVLALEARGLMALEQAWALISKGPARIMGLSDRGEIADGKRADLVILDHTTRHVVATLAGGRLVAGHGPLAIRLGRQMGGALAAE